MKHNDILKMIIDLQVQNVQAAEIREAEMGSCHARIDLLRGAILNVTTILTKSSEWPEGVGEILKELADILENDPAPAAMRKIAAKSGFFRDQHAAELERIRQMIDQMPDE